MDYVCSVDNDELVKLVGEFKDRLEEFTDDIEASTTDHRRVNQMIYRLAEKLPVEAVESKPKPAKKKAAAK